MLNKNKEDKRSQILYACMEDLVPKDHLLRDIDKAIDFSFIYELVEDKYSKVKGRPSIDPVVLFKIVFIQYIFGIRSMRQTIKEIQVNNAYRWFLGYDLLEAVPHFSTFSKNYARRFADTDIFEQIFERILSEAIACGFVDPTAVFIDATHIKASANTKKSVNEQVKIEAKHYHKELMEEVNKDREKHGKKPFDDDDEPDPPAMKNVKKSTVDPECGLFHKGEHQKCFAYTAHVACERHNFILKSDVSAGNVHDSVMFDGLYNKLKAAYPEVQAVVMDAGYKTPWICKQVFDEQRIAVTPYKRPMTKKDFFKKHDYVYDEYYDCVLCPDNQGLTYSTTNRDGYREYKSDSKICISCPLLSQCTASKNTQKVVTLHVWENYIEMAEDIRHSKIGKELYTLRAQTIERVFADAKEKHAMRYTHLRGLSKIKMQVTLTFACMNLKKLALYKKKRGFFTSLKLYSQTTLQFTAAEV
jgi:transposase